MAGRGDVEAREREGYYVHRWRPDWRMGTRTVRVIDHDGNEVEYVSAEDFMQVQKERDDARRALALINAWRWSPAFVDRDVRPLDAQLSGSGLGYREGRAMLGIIAQFASEGGSQ